MAILKRGMTFVAGKHALYVRLPSETDDAQIHRITHRSINQDWLEDPGNKSYYDRFLSNIHELPGDFEEKVAQEQSLLQRSLANKGDTTMKAYTKKANELLSRAIETAQRPPIR